jgi:acyl-CoA synthetase (NDP forming)
MNQLSQEEVKNKFSKYNPTYPKTVYIKTDKDLNSIKIEFPVILKIDSPDIIHKSDSGMVATGINSISSLAEEFRLMKKKLKEKFPKARVNSFIVQEQIKGREVIIGMKRDETFGPVIMFGLGGIFVEILKDVSFRITPISKDDASNMIREIKAYKILEGVRGEKPVNINAIIEILQMVSEISMMNEDIMEIDLNPVIVDEKKAYIVDARLLVGD